VARRWDRTTCSIIKSTSTLSKVAFQSAQASADPVTSRPFAFGLNHVGGASPESIRHHLEMCLSEDDAVEEVRHEVIIKSTSTLSKVAFQSAQASADPVTSRPFAFAAATPQLRRICLNHVGGASPESIRHHLEMCLSEDDAVTSTLSKVAFQSAQASADPVTSRPFAFAAARAWRTVARRWDRTRLAPRSRRGERKRPRGHRVGTRLRGRSCARARVEPCAARVP
jgi:hypothetical protein